MNNMKKYEKMSMNDRINLVQKMFVSHPSFKRCYNKIQMCYDYSKISVEPLCALITGVPGVGKTTLCNEFEKNHKRAELIEKTKIPVLLATIPAPVTPKNMVTELLYAIADPLADEGTGYKQTKRLFKLVEECEVELIILDEFHHVIDPDSKKTIKIVADWLKNLINKTKTPIILVGMPNSIDILRDNKQLSRRFSLKDELADLKWLKSKKSDELDFRSFLKIVNDNLPFPRNSHLADKIIARRIWKATKGNINKIMRLLSYAATSAIKDNEEMITLSYLETTYDLLFTHEEEENPFID